MSECIWCLAPTNDLYCTERCEHIANLNDDLERGK